MRAALDLIKGQIPTRTAVDVEFHGRMLAVDPIMDGQPRFAVMFGSDVVSLRSQNQEVAAQIIAAGSTEVVTYTVIGDVEPGSTIAISNTEHLVVTEVTHYVEQGTKLTRYKTSTAVLGVYAAGTSVTFVAFPIAVIQGTDVTENKVLVDSARALAVGDTITLATTPAAMTYLTDTATITGVQTVFKFTDHTRYIITIGSTKLPITSSTAAQIRVNTAYVSRELLLPELSGPYLADIVGGKTFGTAAENIVIAVTAPEDGMSKEVTRNGVALSLPLKAGDIALLTHENGSSHVVSEDEIEADVSENARWGCGIDLAVPAPVRLNWLIRTSSPLNFIIETDAGSETIALASGATFSLQRELEATQKFTLRASGNGSFRIITNPMRDGVRSMRYSYVVRLTGDEVWSGAGLVLKPLFPRLGDARAHNTDEDTLYISSGGIIL